VSFSLQHRQLTGALEGAGLCPKAAAQIAGILCNGAQELRHAGPMIHDTTPPSMRRVTPDIRKHELPNFDFEEGDPDYRRPKTEPSEEEPPVAPPANVTVTVAPQQAGGGLPIKGGTLSEANIDGAGVRVDVRARVARKPEAGLPMAMIDPQSNSLVGKRLRARVTEGEDRLRAEVRENNEDVSVNLSFKNLKDYDVVTGVEYVPGTGIRVTSEKVTAWSAKEKNTRWIYTQDAEVLTGIADDLHGFRAHAKRIPVFEKVAVRNDRLYFNTFRIGTFDGAWTAGTTKSVQQVWPDGGRSVEVMNYTQRIPDDGEPKYVLFAARTDDRINADDEDSAIDVDGEDEGPIPDVYPPAVRYVALEIQSASDSCETFNYLLGRRPYELPGFDPAQCKALSVSLGDGCLQWTGQQMDVITNVTVSPSAITFMKTPVTILCAGTESEAVTIPITECTPTPPPECGSCTWVWSESGGWSLGYPCSEGCTCGGMPSESGTSDGQTVDGTCSPSP